MDHLAEQDIIFVLKVLHDSCVLVVMNCHNSPLILMSCIVVIQQTHGLSVVICDTLATSKLISPGPSIRPHLTRVGIA